MPRAGLYLMVINARFDNKHSSTCVVCYALQLQFQLVHIGLDDVICEAFTAASIEGDRPTQG